MGVTGEVRAARRSRERATPGSGEARGERTARVLLFLACMAPFALLVGDGLTDRLSADPIEEITHRTGWWALTLLLATLAVTPLRRLTGWNRLARHRRTLGLFAFFYACLHVLTYFGLDQMFALDYIGEDILERPYITVGFTAWLLLVPLAVTSTRGWIRRLGRRWQALHRLAYVSAGLGVLHFLWLVKADEPEPLVFGGVLLGLMALRLPGWRAGRRGSGRKVRRSDQRTTVAPER